MNVATVIDRISASLAAGELVEKRENLQADLLTMADLLRPVDEIFQGERVGDLERRDIFGWKGLLKPRLVPQRRRSSRPLSPPGLMVAPCRFISPGLFTSTQAIWAWYQQKGLNVKELSDQPINEKEFEAFLEDLHTETSDYWPLFINLENLYMESGLLDLEGVSLMLPHWSYEDETAGVAEAFISGASGVEWLVCHYYGQENFLTLPDEDRELISAQGFGDLLSCYADGEEGRTYNLGKLENFNEMAFGPVWEKYPAKKDVSFSIISADAGMDCDVLIHAPEDIDFCLAYAEAFYELQSWMPDMFGFEENDLGITETFVHEICEVWRKAKGMPPVPWTSPSAKERVTV